MKLKIGCYEVEVFARELGNENQNEKDTLHFLNNVSIWASEAADLNRLQGYNGIAHSYEVSSGDIFKALKEKGLYRG